MYIIQYGEVAGIFRKKLLTLSFVCGILIMYKYKG